MASASHNHESISLRLSEVLSDIGVNEEMILKRREGFLFIESLFNMNSPMTGSGFIRYNFGSQSEGSTTIGLNSDIDILVCKDTYHIIPDWADWKPHVKNLLKVQDETTSPGYCLLQLLRDDAPIAESCIPDISSFKHTNGRIILKNTRFHDAYARAGCAIHGPAAMPEFGNSRDADYVFAYRCNIWPIEGRRWLNRGNVGGWPSAQLKSELEMSGCFLVPVDSKRDNGLDDVEWRISTSMAERCLMFSLNITQMRIYVLLKMLLKSYVVFKDVISSYMCKTALFHCIENTRSNLWQEHNLLLCLNQTLHILYNFIYHKNCPHFIIPENNLLAGKISTQRQQHDLMEVIQQIISSDGRMLFSLQTDNVGTRLQNKINSIPVCLNPMVSAVHIQERICRQLFCDAAVQVQSEHDSYLLDANDNDAQTIMQNLAYIYVQYSQKYMNSNYLEKKAFSYLIPLMCSSIGSLLASYCVTINKPLPGLALEWWRRGLNSDVSSGWLKLATVCYSAGDINVTEALLRHIDQKYDRNVVMSVCGCYSVVIKGKQGFDNVAKQIRVTDIGQIVSFCVKFMRCEINIVPQEMRQEYCRSTQENIQHRDIGNRWMDLAVVDSLPYLYFLQYKTYGRLRNREEQQRVLHKLQQVVREEPNLYHKDTALNLLGQCMEQENLPNDAFHYYERSLEFRRQNNAANFYMSRLLAK